MKKGAHIKSTNELLVGDWIFLEEEDDYLYKGWVTEILGSTTINMYCIGYYRRDKFFDVNKKYNNILLNAKRYRIYKEDEISYKDVEYKRDLIDIVLDYGNEEWFKELVD